MSAADENRIEREREVGATPRPYLETHRERYGGRGVRREPRAGAHVGAVLAGEVGHRGRGVRDAERGISGAADHQRREGPGVEVPVSRAAERLGLFDGGEPGVVGCEPVVDAAPHRFSHPGQEREGAGEHERGEPCRAPPQARERGCSGVTHPGDQGRHRAAESECGVEGDPAARILQSAADRISRERPLNFGSSRAGMPSALASPPASGVEW